MRGPIAIVVLFVTVSVWVLFVSRTINVFGEHLRHERDILWEAKLLLDSVCDLPRTTFPLTGELVRCDEAREAVRRGNAHLKAIESTSSRLLSELARTARNELVDVTWALGFVGVCTVVCSAGAFFAFRKFRRDRHTRRLRNARSPMMSIRQSRLQYIEESPGEPSLNYSSDSEDDEDGLHISSKYTGHGLDNVQKNKTD